MATLTEPRATQERGGRCYAHPAPAATIQQGAMVALLAGAPIAAREGQGADNAARAAEAATMVVVGIAEHTAGPGSSGLSVKPGVFLFDNKAGDLVTRSDIGRPCYACDDHTVGRSSPNNTRAKAGQVEDVEGVGVWVRLGS